MKTNLLHPVRRLSFAAGMLVSAALVHATPLTETAAVHTKPDASSPAIAYLKAGTEPVAASGLVANTPAGWLAIELTGPFEGYVLNKDLTKALDVKPGAPIYLAPKFDAPVLTLSAKGDKTTITGLRGKWTQISLEKKLTGYVNLGGTPGYLPPIATAPAGAASVAVNNGAIASPAPVAPMAYGVAGPGQPAPTMSMGDSASTLPRQFAGRFASTRSPFKPRRPFDWALNDDAGKRYAYLDISKLLLTEQVEKFVGHSVVVFGAAKATGDGKDIVIQVESLQLK
jgi:hypothetical protein